MNIKNVFLAVLIIAAVMSAGVSSAKDGEKYQGRGEALIVNNDLPKAKRDALVEAFKSALQKAVGVYVKAQTKVENFELSYQKILSESEGYVKNYKIVKEKTEEGVYSVEIEAEVSSDKLADAFSQRFSKFVEKNLFSSFTIMAYAVNFGNRFYSLMINCTISVNDPTIETDSIRIKLPVTGWMKPSVNRSGLSNLIMVSENIEVKNLASSKYIDDVLNILEKKGTVVHIKFKNPGTGKEEERTLSLEKLTASVSLGIGQAINIQNKELKDISEREMADAIASLKKSKTLLEYEKKRIGMNGNFVLTMLSNSDGKGNFCSFYLSFNIPATSADISSIDASSMQIKLPQTGWVKPEIRETEYSIDVSLGLTDPDLRKFKYLSDIAYYFGHETFEIELKYKNKKTGSIENRIAVISSITVSISEEGKKIFDVQAKSFDKLEAGQKSSISKYLEKLKK